MKRKNNMFRDGTFGVGEIFTACKVWFLKEGKYQRNSLGFFARLFLEQLVITEIFYEIGYTFGVSPCMIKRITMDSLEIGTKSPLFLFFVLNF